MPVGYPPVKQIPLKPNQYYQGIFSKKFIILHHTAGGSAASSIASWAADVQHVATPYVIDRDGTIFECYDPKFWAYHLGKGVPKSVEQASIAIEIASYGPLTIAAKDHLPLPGKLQKYKKGDFITYTDKPIAPDKIYTLAKPHRPSKPFTGLYYEAYTPEQITSIGQLLPYLIDRFKIPLQADRNNFWEYQNPAALKPGIYSHTTVRKDKFDIFPQKELVDLVLSL